MAVELLGRQWHAPTLTEPLPRPLRVVARSVDRDPGEVARDGSGQRQLRSSGTHARKTRAGYLRKSAPSRPLGSEVNKLS
jgi:hypothetical protein